MMADRDIPGADPAAVIEQYKRWVYKIAQRYTPVLERSGTVGLEDLHQVGFIALLEAQKKYDPEKGAFTTFSFNYVRSAMRRTLGFNDNTGAAPIPLVYLDATISADPDGDITLLDTLPDPEALPLDEPIIENETREETCTEVRAAVDRIKSDKQRTAVSLVWFDGKTRKAAADEMGMKHRSFDALESNARDTLFRDNQLRNYARQYENYVMKRPFFNTGVGNYRLTFTSATEAAVIWRDENLPHDRHKERSPAHWSAYARRVHKKYEEPAEVNT
jgi:RNA polymerase sigma factor (sigma-70 family)